MPTYNSPGLRQIVRAGATGNCCVDKGQIIGNGNGGPLVAADVVRLGYFPAGTEIHSGQLICPVATAGLTVSVGLEPVNGTTAIPDLFVTAGTSLATTQPLRFKNGVNMPYTLLVDSFLTVTTAGATVAATTPIRSITEYEYLGNRR